MTTLIGENWLFFLIALLIGVATAYWIWAANRGEVAEDEGFDGDDGLLEKAGDPVPAEPVEAKPEPVPAPASVKPAVAAAVASGAAAKTTPVPKPTLAPAPRPRKKPVVKEAATPAPAGKPKIAAAKGDPDNLRLIKGVGPKLNTLLNKLGVTRFDQIAAWGAEEITEVDQYLETFSGRITRDGWIDQAKFLAKDDIAGFEKKYGKL